MILGGPPKRKCQARLEPWDLLKDGTREEGSFFKDNVGLIFVERETRREGTEYTESLQESFSLKL